VFTSTTEAPILLIGSAHVVDLSAELRRVLGARTLDAVALELDEERAQALLTTGPAATGGGRGSAPFLLLLWARLQRRLGAEIGGGTPGAEMRVAAQIARERNLPILLIDDPIRETIGRLLRSLSVKERVSLLLGGLLGLVLPSRVVEKQLEIYSETPEPFLEQIRSSYPTVARVLLDERNEHMADRLAAARGRGFGRVAAVVGDAHVGGLSAALNRRGIPVERISFGELTRPPAITAP
jgi:pheromone shutdown protein TraB